MGFECPNYSEGRCYLQEDGSCTPTRGNCILKGRFRTFQPEDYEKPADPEAPDSVEPTSTPDS